jgi:hypothetical protein
MARACVCAFVLGILALTGCNSSSGNTFSGEVRYKGQPVAEGMIYLDPTDPPNNRPTAGPIRDGKFHIPTSDGLRAGHYRVRITANDPGSKSTNVPQTDADGLPTGPAYKELIPAKYNTNSELTFEVKAGINDHTFDLKK